MAEDSAIQIVPLGGLGEFGMNTLAVRCRGDILIVDAGLMFPRDDLLGVDLVVPDLTYLKERREEIRGVILTHGHEDHIGGLAYLLEEFEVPVFGTALAIGFAKSRLSEHGLLENVMLHRIRPRDVLRLGCFTIECLRVTHSIADSIGLAISTPGGLIVHTGDFKFDQSPTDGEISDFARLSRLGEEGVLALLSDSTNSERPGHTPSESHVRRHLELVFHSSRQKIIVACFASSIHRIQILTELAEAFGRRVVPLGRSMRENIAIAHQLGFLRLPPGILCDGADGAQLPRERVVLLCTGSQGEPMAALSNLALGKHKGFTIESGDSVILSARVIPGNESRISQLINHFCRRGARVYDENRWAVHVSGHASQEELKMMLNLTRPRFFIPIHGEYRQLYHHSLLAIETGIPKERVLIAETGDIIQLTADSINICGKAPVGRRLIDQDAIAELDERIVRDRQHISEEGVVLAVVPVNKSTGQLEGQPELVSRGHLQGDGDTDLLSAARQAVMNALAECSGEERTDSTLLSEVVRGALKRFYRKQTSTRPMIVPVILEI